MTVSVRDNKGNTIVSTPDNTYYASSDTPQQAAQKAIAAANRTREQFAIAARKNPAAYLALAATTRKSIEKILTSDQKNSVLAAVKTYQSTVATSPNAKTVNGLVGKPPKVTDSSLQQLAFTLYNNPTNAKKRSDTHYILFSELGFFTTKTSQLGSLVIYTDETVPKSQVNSLLKELRKTGLSNSHLNNIINDDEATYLVLTNKNPNATQELSDRIYSYKAGFDGEANTIIASPGYALQYLRNGKPRIIRPDVGIGHEVDHAQQKAVNFDQWAKDVQTTLYSPYTSNYNAEERRAWTNEVAVSLIKGIPSRNSYDEPANPLAKAKFVRNNFLK